MEEYNDDAIRVRLNLTRAEFAEVLVRMAELMTGEEVGGLDLRLELA